MIEHVSLKGVASFSSIASINLGPHCQVTSTIRQVCTLSVGRKTAHSVLFARLGEYR